MNPFRIVLNLIKWLYDQLHPHPTVIISNSDSDSDYDSASSVRESERILRDSFLKPSDSASSSSVREAERILRYSFLKSSDSASSVRESERILRYSFLKSSASSSSVREAERILGYTFLKPSLLEEALTHRSSKDTLSNQRLEFIGDAALNLAMTNYLYSSHRDLTRGHISRLRSANVCNERLARVAVRHNIYPLVRRNSPHLDKEVEEFTKAVMLEPEDQIYGGITKKAPKVLPNVVEAIAAAIYEDCNFNLDVMWKVVRRLLKPLITADTFSEQSVTKLCELCQKSCKEVQFLPRQNGNTTIVDVLVDGEKVGYGSAEQVDIAKLNAARYALEMLCGEKSDLLKSQHKKGGEEEKAKQKLNAFCTKMQWPLPVYKLEEKKGPAHNRTYICSVHVETTYGNLIKLGEDRSRVKDAERSAALKMLAQVGKLYV